MDPKNVLEFLSANWAALLVAALIVVPITWKVAHEFYRLRIARLKESAATSTPRVPDADSPPRASDEDRIYFPDNVEDFYRYYRGQTLKAQETIWVTSDGYNWRSPTSREYGQLMIDARCDAMSNGVTLYWFQITETMHLNWLEQLRLMKQRFPTLFRVYHNPVLTSVPNVCVIDPDSPHSVTERMEHRTGTFGQGSEAVSASFAHGDSVRAAQTKRIVKEAIEHPASRELDAKGLQTLEKELFEARLKRLKAWHAETETTGIDFAGSGVFDERVIDHFVRSFATNAGESENEGGEQ